MKNITKAFAILILTVFMVSCENETTNNPSEVSEELVNIRVTAGSDFSDWNITDGLNTEIVTSYNNHTINTFNNGKVVMREYYIDGVYTRFESFEYDSSDRIVNNTKTDLTSNDTTVYSYEYVENTILATRSDYDSADNLIDQYTYSFTLNANNQIVHYENSDGTTYWDATYTNGNLTGFVSHGYSEYSDGTATFTYSSELVSEPYHLESFLFGPEWRNNMMLRQTGFDAFKRMSEFGVGSNYITGYTYTVASDPNMTITFDATYEFDASGRLSMFTRSKSIYNSSPLITVFNYEYE